MEINTGYSKNVAWWTIKINTEKTKQIGEVIFYIKNKPSVSELKKLAESAYNKKYK